MPTTTLGVLIWRTFTLYKDKMSVVDAKENRPLKKSIERRIANVCYSLEENSQRTRISEKSVTSALKRSLARARRVNGGTVEHVTISSSFLNVLCGHFTNVVGTGTG